MCRYGLVPNLEPDRQREPRAMRAPFINLKDGRQQFDKRQRNLKLCHVGCRTELKHFNRSDVDQMVLVFLDDYNLCIGRLNDDRLLSNHCSAAWRTFHGGCTSLAHFGYWP